MPASFAKISKSSYQEIWEIIKQDLLKKYGEGVFNSWFNKLDLGECTNGNVVLYTPTKFIKNWITTNYLNTIFQLWNHYDQEVQEVNLSILENKSLQPSYTDFSTKSYEDNSKNIFSSNLDSRFTFDNFVVGNSNQLAYTAAYAVAESEKSIVKSNPLFLYGGVGLGKTHLMHAIAWHIKEHNIKRRVIYMSAEKFMYKFVNSLRNKNIMHFKEQFRSVDVLMIDDIQFICGKDSTQEEFFHTFNALIDDNKQIVISCDRSPSDLDNIEDRIKSRLGWGLVVDVHSTTYELRLGILLSKIEQINIYVPQKVIEFLAAKINSNVRELEGALNKILAYATLSHSPITLESTQEILRDLLRSNEKFITIEDIQKRISEHYNIKMSDMISVKRVRTIARPRQIAMYISKLLTSKSLADIGRQFGNKDHTTIMHAVSKIEELCAK